MILYDEPRLRPDPPSEDRRKGTDNEKLEAEGHADQTKADAKKAGENVKDVFKD